MNILRLKISKEIHKISHDFYKIKTLKAQLHIAK